MYSHNILHPLPPSQPLTLYHITPAHYPPCRLTNHPSPPLVADCLFISLIVNNCCDFSCTGPHIPGGYTFSATPWAWNNRHKHYSKHLLCRHVSSLLLCDDGIFPTPTTPLLSKLPSTSLYQVFPLAIVTSCIFFPRLLVVSLVLLTVSGFPGIRALGYLCMSKGLTFPFMGVFIWFCFSWPWTFFICLVYVAGFVVSDSVHS